MLVMFTNEYKFNFNTPYFSYIYFTITIKLTLQCELIEVNNTFRKELSFGTFMCVKICLFFIQKCH